ncbi:MAG: shikimate dehydrogenase [Rhodothermales bacterium]|nr:shikimate dehydrogenase [Rhodothermales bacterium]
MSVLPHASISEYESKRARQRCRYYFGRVVQLTNKTGRRVIQYRQITGSTRLVTLLGYPVTHSLSPLIHNAAFAAAGLDYAYVTAAVEPGNLKQAIEGLAALGVAGSNVTVPHKQEVHDLIDVTSEDARFIGAVNTLTFDRSGDRCRISGDNTDIEGFTRSLDLYRPNLINSTVAVLGAGGAARAVSYALLKDFQPESLTLVVRDIQKGLVAANVLDTIAGDCQMAVVTFAEASDSIRSSRLVINATPAGMAPNADVTPWETATDFHSGQLVYDLIYAPEKTRLLAEAENMGAETLNGLEMLIWQAAASFKLWTNEEMPVDTVRQILQEHLAKR